MQSGSESRGQRTVLRGARRGGVRLYKCMGLREVLWLLQVTPAMLRGIADEMEPENEEAVS